MVGNHTLVLRRRGQGTGVPRETANTSAGQGRGKVEKAAGMGGSDRVRRERMTHDHEGWQLQESAKGGWFCAACGQPVNDTEAQKLGKPPVGSTKP